MLMYLLMFTILLTVIIAINKKRNEIQQCKYFIKYNKGYELNITKNQQKKIKILNKIKNCEILINQSK